MVDGPYIAEAASLIGNPARANILTALLDGRARTATELGLAAGVAPSTASGHLGKLLGGSLVSAISSGRHRYYRLASPAVADLLEGLMAVAIDGPPRHRPKSPCSDAMARARTCYDHLAGKLGVAVAESLAERKLILLSDQEAIITSSGRAFLREIGVQPEKRAGPRRALCRACLDWSERRWHIGGAIGAAIADRSFELGWTLRQLDSRALTITPGGEKAFEELFGFRV